MRVLVREVKWNAVGRRTADQRLRWEQFLSKAESIGRARAVPDTTTVIGSDWVVDCEDREHAEWLCGWLKDRCGFVDSMLQVRRS